MVEIGPGLGALTGPLLAAGLPALTVIELDRDLAARHGADTRLRVIQSDVLNVDFAALRSAQGSQLRVVGNLPYNISTPVLFHLLGFAEHIQDQCFMLQKEVVERMVAAPATAAYGRLSVMLQWRYEMHNRLHIGPECFYPAPKVDSAVVQMLPRSVPVVLDPNLLSEIVRVAFSQRRKLLRHTLGAWLQARLGTYIAVPEGGAAMDAAVLACTRFDVQRRAEEVPVAQYCTLAQALSDPAISTKGLVTAAA